MGEIDKCAVEAYLGHMTSSMPSLELGTKDKRILLELSANARRSMTSIAQATKLSREVVMYRVNRLEKKGFITGYTAHIDYSRLGYVKHKIYLQLQNHSKEIEHQLIEKFLKDDRIIWVGLCSGNWDIGLIIVNRGVEDFSQHLNDILTACGPYLKDHIILTGVKETYLGYKFIGDQCRSLKLSRSNDTIAFESEFANASPSADVVKLDSFDKKILSALIRNARIELRELSRLTKLSLATVRRKIQRLINEGVIMSFWPFYSPDLIGYEWYLTYFRLINLTQKEEAHLLTYCQQHPNITFAWKQAGKWNLQLNIWVKDAIRYKAVIDDIRTQFTHTISDYETVQILGQLKYTQPLQ